MAGYLLRFLKHQGEAGRILAAVVQLGQKQLVDHPMESLGTQGWETNCPRVQLGRRRSHGVGS